MVLADYGRSQAHRVDVFVQRPLFLFSGRNFRAPDPHRADEARANDHGCQYLQPNFHLPRRDHGFLGHYSLDSRGDRKLRIADDARGERRGVPETQFGFALPLLGRRDDRGFNFGIQRPGYGLDVLHALFDPYGNFGDFGADGGIRSGFLVDFDGFKFHRHRS